MKRIVSVTAVFLCGISLLQAQPVRVSETLKELEIGKSAVIETVGGSGELRQHFLDMGMIPGAEVTVVKLAPMGDPMELQVHGYELTLRLAEADPVSYTHLTLPTTSRV